MAVALLGAAIAAVTLATPAAAAPPAVPSVDVPHPQGVDSQLRPLQENGKVAPGAVAATDAGPPITRAEILARAQTWVDARVPYNQKVFRDGYRTDCSGYVSMAWHVNGNYWTGDLNTIATPIAFGELLPGDMLLFHDPSNPVDGSHAVLFDHWTGAVGEDFYMYEQTPPYTLHRKWSDTSGRKLANYKPYRYVNVVEPPTPAVVAGQMVDFDGDGRVDTLGLNGNRDELWFVPNTSSGGTLGRGASVRVSAGWQSVGSLMVTDWDGDGRPDVLGRTGDVLLGWRNLSTVGHPAVGSAVSLGVGWNTVTHLMTGDFNGDGRPDIAATSLDGDQVWIIPNTSSVGNLSRGASSYLSSGWRTVTTLMAVDYDHDGYTDFVGRDPDQLFVWRNTYNGSFRIGGGVSLGLGWSVFNKLIPGDFNGDGKPDIAGVTNDGDQVWIVPNTSSGSTLSRGTSSYLSSGWKTISTFMAGDYDHDGTTDFVGRDPDQLFVWRVTYNGTYHISGGVSLGLGWSTISAFVTQQ